MLCEVGKKSSIKKVLKLVFSGVCLFFIGLYFYCSSCCYDSCTISKWNIVQSMNF